MSVNDFATNENVNMLWEVISDEDCFKFHSRDVQNVIYDIFLKNIPGFFKIEKRSTNTLVNINKKYILLVLKYIRENHPYKANKIQILEETKPTLITYEEIQNDRNIKWNTEFEKKQKEFDDFMVIKQPNVPNFMDGEKDVPITDMDKILNDMKKKRNYEIAEISEFHSLNNNIVKTDTENSINTADESFKKNVSFNEVENIQMFYSDDIIESETNDIFSKLKKKNDNKDDLNKPDLNNDNKNYKNNNSLDINNLDINNIDKRLTYIENDLYNIHSKIDRLISLLEK